jgi:hypothetical protein
MQTNANRNLLRALIFMALSMLVGYFLGSLKGLVPAYHNRSVVRSSLVGSDHIDHSRYVTHTAIINTLVERYQYKSYLEVGQGHREHNLDWIKCPIKIGIDPDVTLNATYQITSDEFFETNKQRYDLIFVDGLHTAEQAYRDIINSLATLNENGTIVVHDCDPTDERWQRREHRLNSEWTGDVWKAWVRLRATRGDLKMCVVDTDYGCGVIRKGVQKLIHLPEILTYAEFDQNRKEWLNLIEVSSFLEDLKKNPPATGQAVSTSAGTLAP